MHPVAIVLVAALFCGSAVAVAWMYRVPTIARAKREERRADGIDSVVTELRAEFGRAIAQVMDLEDSIKRHRARIDGATRGNPQPAQQQLQLADLTDAQVALLPPAAQREWVMEREARRRRAN